MKNRLIENYIFNVTKNLSKKEKISVEKKLREDISWILKSKNLTENSSDEEIKTALKTFGTPADVALKYKTDGGKALISEPYFSVYKSDLNISLFVSILTLVLTGVLYYLNSPDQDILKIVMNTAFNLIMAIFSIYSIYTIWFSIGTGAENFSLENLVKQDPPKNKNKISKLKIVSGIFLSTLLFSFLAFGSKIIEKYYGGLIFKSGYIESNIVAFFAIFVFSSLNIITKDLSKRYTLKVLFTTLIYKIILLSASFLFFVKDGAISENLKTFLLRKAPVNNFFIYAINNLNLTVFFIIALFSLINIIYVALKYHDDKNVEVEEKPVREIKVEEPVKMEEKPTSQDTIKIDREDLNKSLETENTGGETIVMDKEEFQTKLNAEENADTTIVKKDEIQKELEKKDSTKNYEIPKTEVQKIEIDSEKLKNNFENEGE